MKAIAVRPGTADSLHTRVVRRPEVASVADGRGVLVKVLRVGVDGTDREIIEAKYGASPPGDDYLIIGHEGFGVVVEVGPQVPDSHAPGTYVVASVRRPGSSIYDRIGLQDMTTDAQYHERGINLLHGFLTEYYVEDFQFLVPLPTALEEVGVLLEPASISQKGMQQAYEIQRRLAVWRPARACVLGVGAIGLLAALALRLRGLDVTCVARRPPPTLPSRLVEQIGARYVSLHQQPLDQIAREHGPFDLIFEATGNGTLAFDAMRALAKNGVLVLVGVPGGTSIAQIQADHLVKEFVLGNKVMVGTVNASLADFARGVGDFLAAETRYPGWLAALLTTPIHGLDDPAALLHALTDDDEAIKVYVQVASG